MRRAQYLLFLATVIAVAAAIYAAITDAFPLPVSSTLYALAAVGLACTISEEREVSSSGHTAEYQLCRCTGLPAILTDSAVCSFRRNKAGYKGKCGKVI